jgi:radical SAM enzyme (TIGR01210 family)
LDVSTLFLTNRECPWHCVMCDLWKNTTDTTVPRGAIPKQIDFALSQLPAATQIKLYNSGSFFDSAAIPLADYVDIVRAVGFARHIIVESHPRLVGEKTLRLRHLLSGSLEVAMGLETIHPHILPRLNKKFDLGHFARAADFLRANGITLRAFVLVKPPFLEEGEALEWALKSAAFAFSCGAAVVTLIPTRGGNGAMERLRESGEFAPPKLSTLEHALELALNLRAGRVFADTWDLETFSVCAVCLEERRKRLHAMNLSQTLCAPVTCSACAGA